MRPSSKFDLNQRIRAQGIYLLPNIFTTAALFAGFFAVVQAMNLGFLVAVWPMFLWMKSAPGFESVLVVSIVAGVLMAMVGGAGPVMFTEMFPTRLRSTPIGIGYNVSAAIFGGFAPFICTWLVQQTGDPIAPTWFLLFCAAASFLTVLGLRDRTNVPADEL